MRRIATAILGLLLACLPVHARCSGNYHTYHARAHSSRSHSQYTRSDSTRSRSHHAHSYSARTQPGVNRNRQGGSSVARRPNGSSNERRVIRTVERATSSITLNPSLAAGRDLLDVRELRRRLPALRWLERTAQLWNKCNS
jgi:hypothetical protein